MRKTVVVCPPAERERRKRLFGALEEALPVRFEGREPDQLRTRLDGAILFEDTDPGLLTHQPCFVAGGSSRVEVAGVVELGASQPLDARLRGRALVDSRAAGLAGLQVDGDIVRASCRGKALWIRRGAVERVALAPDELLPEESLRDLLAPGRWLSLLPLVHFLRDLASGSEWQPPRTRAAFVIDDPNLHWPSYGHVHFADLARAGEERNFHVAFATIPLRRVVRPPTSRAALPRQASCALAPHPRKRPHTGGARPPPFRSAGKCTPGAGAPPYNDSGRAVRRRGLARHGRSAWPVHRADDAGRCCAWAFRACATRGGRHVPSTDLSPTANRERFGPGAFQSSLVCR